MKNFCKILAIIIIIFFGLRNNYAQQFSAKPLVTIPGENFDFDLVTTNFYNLDSQSYISWINKQDSVYSVYFAKLKENIDSTILVASDTVPFAHARISFGKNEIGFRIVWQSLKNGKWRVMHAYLDDKYNISSIETISDTLSNCVSPSVSIGKASWIENDKLIVSDITDSGFVSVVVDSGKISNPDMQQGYNNLFASLLYVKGDSGSHQIFEADYTYYGDPHWSISQLTHEGDNINPRYGAWDGLAFETKIDSVWRIDYGGYSPGSYLTSNANCNFHNPIFFAHPIVTKRSAGLDFFFAFDSDSLNDNNEIFVQKLNFVTPDTLMNVSNSPGNDYYPNIGVLVKNDTIYIAFVWIHEENNIKQLWYAEGVFNPNWGDVNENHPLDYSFSLHQNYPNPFNPSTKIGYEIKSSGKPEHVKLSIYNTLGQEIAVLVNEYQPGGTYSVDFNGDHHASGVYFYKLSVGSNVQAKKMILLR